jgi:hypothetical protein
VAGLDSEVEILTFEEEEEKEPAIPKPVRKSSKDKRKNKRKKSAPPESEGRIVIRLKTTGSPPTVEAVRKDGWEIRPQFWRRLYIARRTAPFWPRRWRVYRRNESSNPYEVRMRCDH